MTALIVTLAVAYTLVAAGWFTFNVLGYLTERDWDKKGARHHARQALQAPLWPLAALAALRDLLAAAREEGSE